MPLDFVTLLAITAINLCMLAAVLPLIMGAGVSRAARSVQASVALQALGWVTIIASTYVRGTVWDQALSSASIACTAAAQWALIIALGDWLGPRPGARWAPVLALVIPLGYTLGFGHYAFRVGWSNFLLAALVLLVARATLTPVRPAQSRWRMLLCGCLVLMAGFTFLRGLLGAFTDAYPSFRTPHPVNVGSAIAANITAVLGVVALMVAWRTEAEDKLRALATTDALTGVPNRRGFDLRAQALLGQALHARQSVTALMFDLDHFKRINDTHGHPAGDAVLQALAELLQRHARSGDMACRHGGEEFVLLLAGTPLHVARERAEAVRADFEALQVSLKGGIPVSATLSCGIAAAPGHSDSPQLLMACSDKALYAAKLQGRNRVVTFSECIPAVQASAGYA